MDPLALGNHRQRILSLTTRYFRPASFSTTMSMKQATRPVRIPIMAQMTQRFISTVRKACGSGHEGGRCHRRVQRRDVPSWPALVTATTHRAAFRTLSPRKSSPTDISEAVEHWWDRTPQPGHNWMLMLQPPQPPPLRTASSVVMM